MTGLLYETLMLIKPYTEETLLVLTRQVNITQLVLLILIFSSLVKNLLCH